MSFKAGHKVNVAANILQSLKLFSDLVGALFFSIFVLAAVAY